MKYALHSVSYGGTVTSDQVELPLAKIFEKAKSFGFDGVTVMAKRPHALPLDLSADARKKLKDQAAERGLKIVCIAAYSGFGSPQAIARELNLAYLLECLKLASDLGASFVRSFIAGMGRPHVGPSAYQQIEWAAAYHKEATKLAADLGVVMVIQNHSPVGQSYHNVKEVVDMVNSPNLRAALDCPLLEDVGEAYEEALTTCKDIFALTTAGDGKHIPGSFVPLGDGAASTITFRGSAVGDGDCDWHAFFSALKRIGYNGWMNYEMCSRMPGGGSEANLDKICQRSLAHLKKVEAEVFG